jgi:hypothetical protein
MIDDKQIKTIIADYIKVDDEITEINKQVKEIKLKKKNLEDSIKSYMEANDISKVDLPIGCLKITKSSQQKKLSKKEIVPVLIDYNIEDSKVNEIITELFDDDDVEEKTKMVRTKK